MPEISREERFKYMDLLQSCISRMAKDSFMVKGWAASFVVAILVYVLKNDASGLCIIAMVIPIAVFWKLDAFFLRTEKCYRLMYEFLIGSKDPPEEWQLYDLNPQKYSKFLKRKDSKDEEHDVSEWDVMCSKTLWPFYVLPMVVLLLIGGEKFLRATPSANSKDHDARTAMSKFEASSEDGGKFNYKFEMNMKEK